MLKSKFIPFAILCVVSIYLALSADSSPTGKAPLVSGISGDYVEARNCDVWTGPCFSNSEINLSGDHAVVGWIVRKGVWDGVKLASLSVVAVIDSDGTLTTKTEGEARAVLYVDRKASPEQEKALIAMARKLAPKYLQNVTRVKRAQIGYRREGARATLEVGKNVEVKVATMALSHCDLICGNEDQEYPALSGHTQVACVKTLENLYRGSDLKVRWSDPNARSAMIGSFSF